MSILFIHGIGIGLVTYKELCADLVDLGEKDSPDDQVGIMVVEIMSISFRVTSNTLRRKEMVRQTHQILHHHGWDKQRFMLAAHSYGTMVATHLLRDPTLSPWVGPVVLIDPITVWFHMGDIPYSFTAKLPESASEIQLHYFACTDIGAAESVTRRFVWTDSVLWKKDLQGRPFGIVLGGRDIIGNPKKCRDYLLSGYSDVELHSSKPAAKGELVKVKQLEVLYLDNMNHAEVFHCREERKALVDMIWRYCCG